MSSAEERDTETRANIIADTGANDKVDQQHKPTFTFGKEVRKFQINGCKSYESVTRHTPAGSTHFAVGTFASSQNDLKISGDLYIHKILLILEDLEAEEHEDRTVALCQYYRYSRDSSVESRKTNSKNELLRTNILEEIALDTLLDTVQVFEGFAAVPKGSLGYFQYRYFDEDGSKVLGTLPDDTYIGQLALPKFLAGTFPDRYKGKWAEAESVETLQRTYLESIQTTATTSDARLPQIEGTTNGHENDTQHTNGHNNSSVPEETIPSKTQQNTNNKRKTPIKQTTKLKSRESKDKTTDAHTKPPSSLEYVPDSSEEEKEGTEKSRSSTSHSTQRPKRARQPTQLQDFCYEDTPLEQNEGETAEKKKRRSSSPSKSPEHTASPTIPKETPTKGTRQIELTTITTQETSMLIRETPFKRLTKIPPIMRDKTPTNKHTKHPPDSPTKSDTHRDSPANAPDSHSTIHDKYPCHPCHVLIETLEKGKRKFIEKKLRKKTTVAPPSPSSRSPSPSSSSSPVTPVPPRSSSSTLTPTARSSSPTLAPTARSSSPQPSPSKPFYELRASPEVRAWAARSPSFKTMDEKNKEKAKEYIAKISARLKNNVDTWASGQMKESAGKGNVVV